MASNIPDLKNYPTFKTYEYFILDGSQEKLQKVIDKELKVLYKDGTLAKLSKEFYGGDYAPSADNYK